ncbi:MAG: hypothetical protein II445_01145, partial [Muribaculaceae bacterium]|nr:hypothetical protein [Muribaculaceae bacterium]
KTTAGITFFQTITNKNAIKRVKALAPAQSLASVSILFIIRGFLPADRATNTRACNFNIL